MISRVALAASSQEQSFYDLYFYPLFDAGFTLMFADDLRPITGFRL
tara:strand:- start:48 stop:185 length:138 start_codon:yes stop_codon:yes gene_type:complete